MSLRDVAEQASAMVREARRLYPAAELSDVLAVPSHVSESAGSDMAANALGDLEKQVRAFRTLVQTIGDLRQKIRRATIQRDKLVVKLERGGNDATISQSIVGGAEKQPRMSKERQAALERREQELREQFQRAEDRRGKWQRQLKDIDDRIPVLSQRECEEQRKREALCGEIQNTITEINSAIRAALEHYPSQHSVHPKREPRHRRRHHKRTREVHVHPSEFSKPILDLARSLEETVQLKLSRPALEKHPLERAGEDYVNAVRELRERNFCAAFNHSRRMEAAIMAARRKYPTDYRPDMAMHVHDALEIVIAVCMMRAQVGEPARGEITRARQTVQKAKRYDTIWSQAADELLKLIKELELES